MSENLRFQSALATPIAGYIAEKQAVGYHYQAGTKSLKRFDAFVKCNYPNEKDLTKQMVIAWTARKPNETISTQNGRISLVRGLAEYMNRTGHPAYICPRRGIALNRYHYSPYIFSSEQIKRIFEVCDHYPQHEYAPNRHLILPLLLRMLYGCGLRISEAMNLTKQDVDLYNGTLYIHNTKFNKERMLPMADSLTERCREYCRAINNNQTENPFFFPSPSGGHYSEGTVYKFFRLLLHQAGISHLGRGKGPRLHDFRHVFAVNCLLKWFLEGKDLNNCLPYLSAYLGHEDIRGSQRYLRLTADLYPDITSKVETFCSHIIPGVDFYETN